MSSKCKASTSFEHVTRPSSAGVINCSGIIKRKSSQGTKTPTLDLNKLSMELGKKDYPDAIKHVLAEDSVYQVLKCKINTKTKFGPVLYVDVRRAGGDLLSTYFSVLYTKKLIKKVELQGFNLETSPELLIGLNFIYRGEVESSEGNTYSKLEFCSEEEQNYYEEAAGY